MDTIDSIQHLLDQASPEEARQLVEKMLNTHPTHQQTFFRNVIWPFILGMSTKQSDLRNEASVTECRRLVKSVVAQWGTVSPPIPNI